MVEKTERFTASAVIPDQLIGYVNAISGLQSQACGECPLHLADKIGVLAAYPPSNPLDEHLINETVDLAIKNFDLETLTVLSPVCPKCAPKNARITKDMYWKLDVPASVPPKTQNMIRRGQMELDTMEDRWTQEHRELVKDFCERKTANLEACTCFLFEKIDQYLANTSCSKLYSARLKDNTLAGCAIADFSSLATAFYMFAFRKKNAPPGTSDALLNMILEDARNFGHSILNLGLGINDGIKFFKKKWGAVAFLPYVETTWKVRKKSWFGGIFGKK